MPDTYPCQLPSPGLPPACPGEPWRGARTTVAAAWKHERRDSRLPDVANADILAREPEGALVHGVERHAEVVAPAFGLVLHAAAADQDLLVAQAPERVVTAPTGEAKARIHGGARDAV